MNKQINNKKFEIRKLGLTAGLVLMTICLPGQLLAQKTKPKPKPKQTQTSSKNSTADRRLDEGIKLFEQGTRESLVAAADKFASAYLNYYAGKDSEGMANSSMLMGRTYKKLNDLNLAFTHYNNALEEYEKQNNNKGKAAALNNIAGVMRDLGKFNEALGYYQQSLPLMRSANNKNGEAQTLNGIGECLLNFGKIMEAKGYFASAQGIQESLSASEDKVRTDYNLGRVYLSLGDAKNGLEYFEQSLRDSRKYDNPILEGDILESLAIYYHDNGELTKAIEYRRRIFNAYSNAKAFAVTPARVLLSVNSLIVSYYRAGDFQNAFKFLDEGIAYGTKHNEKNMTAYLYGNKGVLLVDQGDYDDGMSFLNQGIESSRQTNNKFTEAYFLASLGIAHYEVGEEQEGINALNQALQLIPTGLAPEVEGKIISGLIRVYAGMENKGKTQEMIRLAASRKLDNGVNAGVVQVLAAAGYAEHVFDNNKESLRLLNSAFSIATKLNHEVEKAKILFDVAGVYRDENNYQNALQAVQTSHDFWKKIGNQSMDLETHYEMAKIYSLIDQDQAAIDNFKTVLGFPQEIGLNNLRASSHLFLGLIYSTNKDYQSSLDSYNMALTMFENLGDKNSQKMALNGIADVYEELKDKKKAKEFRDRVKKIKN